MQNKIFDYFDKAYCINLKENVFRKKSAINQFRSIGLEDVDFVPGIKPEDKGIFKSIRAHGCTLSHYSIFKLAKEEKVKTFIIFEDDVRFSDEFVIKIPPIIEELKKVDWDIFYFFEPKRGYKDIQKNRGEIIKNYESGLVKTYGSVLTHAYAINSKCIDELIEKIDIGYLEKNNSIDLRIIDKSISNLDLNFFACNVDLTYQSDVQNKNSFARAKSSFRHFKRLLVRLISHVYF